MTKPKLWLTYAWKDNEDAQVDHVYHELIDAGLDVRLDRTQLTVGQRLWPQIDAGITDPEKCDGWAIYATKKSLESEPCLEEIAYALDRALRKRETDFPIIGIFPELGPRFNSFGDCYSIVCQSSGFGVEALNRAGFGRCQGEAQHS